MKKIITLCAFLLIFSISCGAVGSMEENTIKNLIEITSEPTVSQVGGEWLILALTRGNFKNYNDYIEKYLGNVNKILKEKDGILSNSKYSEYSRLIIALSALNKDVSNINGYNLLAKISDFDKVKRQGINGVIYALIALDTKNYEVPKTDAKVLFSREAAVDYILSKELEGGGFSLDGTNPEPDVTGMALQALSKYTNIKEVNDAVLRSVELLSKMQNEQGGFGSIEDIAQVIIGLNSLNIDVENDPRFIKNNNNLISALKSYYIKDKGFSHILGEDFDQMASEQAICALISLRRFKNNESGLFEMKDSLYKTIFINIFDKLKKFYSFKVI